VIDLPADAGGCASVQQMPHSRFTQQLQQQVRAEFTASQQYLAVAVWFDGHDLPQLASHFYQQSLEERNHGLMMVRHMLDRDLPVEVPAVSEVRNSFQQPRDLIATALEQERAVTGQIEALFRTARQDDDVLGEQFMLWFLKEQVEEVAEMTTLLTIAERAGEDWFKIEEFLARERVGDSGVDASAPPIAGG
jgi:ferritin